MDRLYLVVGIIALVGTVVAAVVSIVAYAIGVHRHQKSAQQKRDEVVGAYPAFAKNLREVEDAFQRVSDTLGPRDRAFFERKRDTLHLAAKSGGAYLDFIQACADPDSDDLRLREYRKIHAGYQERLRAFETRNLELTKLRAECTKLMAEISNVHANVDTVTSLMEGARSLLRNRHQKGWDVEEFCRHLDDADDTFAHAAELIVACEYLSALRTLRVVYLQATEVASDASQLPLPRQAILRKARDFERKHDRLGRKLSEAEEALAQLKTTHAESYWQVGADMLEDARGQHNGIPEQLKQMLACATPQRGDWDKAEEMAEFIAGDLEDVEDLCNDVIDAPEWIERLRQEASQLQHLIADGLAELKDDTGQQQAHTRLMELDAEVRAFVAAHLEGPELEPKFIEESLRGFRVGLAAAALCSEQVRRAAE